MGTRSTTEIRDGRGEVLVNMYRQHDGYPSGHGKALATWLKPINMVNGLSSRDPRPLANGAGCLAAQMVAHFKGPNPEGGFYLHAAGDRQEYSYLIDVAWTDDFRRTAAKGDDPITVTVLASDGKRELFKGGREAFAAWAKNPKSDSDESDDE